MPEVVLDVLKYAFLAVLYLFIGRAVRAVYTELRPAAVVPSAPTRGSERRGRKAPRRAAVVEGDVLKGKSFDLADELIIGRAAQCHIVIDDSYVSQMHARIFARNGSYMLEDLGSTNGTYLNRKRITAPTELQRGDRVKIGKTVLELRR